MKIINRLIVVCSAIIMLSACNDEEVAPAPSPEPNEISTEAAKQVTVNKYLDQVRSMGFGAPGAILTDQGGFRGGRAKSASSWSRMRKFMNANQRNLDNGVCVAQIFVLNDDGSFAWVIDFGDGCEIDGEFWKGKVVETYHLDEAARTYQAFIGFEGFGQETWTIDGLAALEGSYQDEEGFSTEFTFVKNLEIQDEYESWSIKLVGQESLNEEAWTVLEMAADINYENTSTAETMVFKNLVIEPLVYDFTCGDEIVTFVAGIDALKVNHKELILFFGDGTCDNLIVVKEGIFEVVVDVTQQDEIG